MILEFFKPSPPLELFVSSCLVFEDEGSIAKIPMNIVPSGLTEIAIHYGDRCDSHLNYPGEVKGGYIYGPHTSPGFFMASGRIKCLCVLFRPYGAFRVLGHPQVEFRNHAVNLEEVCGSEGADLIEQVSLANTPAQRAELMDSFLLRQFYKTVKRTICIDEALYMLLEAHGNVKVRDICRQSGLSIKTLERQFKNTVGLTPKEFSAIIRINHAYSLMAMNNSDIQDIVFDCGYYDQSHFINDFRQITGLTPDVIRKNHGEHVIYLNRMYTF